MRKQQHHHRLRRLKYGKFYDEKSDVILLKILRARDFKIKEEFSMLKNLIAWRKEFKIDELLEEEGIGEEGLEKFAYLHGVDKNVEFSSSESLDCLDEPSLHDLEYLSL
ncbi:Patellin-2-like [Forsythia ovata]|uniref:Patellin-2-like n=1 Tax=Forsythia ovata TaxID=205694 RepID=A0ABD1V0J8_9LAMI